MKTGTAVVVIAMCVFAFALAGCSSLLGSESQEAQQASANRQYMAQLNQQMADLQQVMDDFQTAVSEQNTVAMKAQVEKAEAIAQRIDAGTATDELADAKGLYVDALSTLNGAMKDYADLYIEVENGTVSAEDVESRVKDIQDAYDDGVAKLQEADNAVAALAQG
ncbi:MAG: hypothetical protein J5804_05240 [Eggerthellaceae bacterium]|nr:hypothetical protein [Eggerthellaceae bacterium]